jgi:hypothetical protein
MSALHWLQSFCFLSFCVYGVRCVRSAQMTAEFVRYGIPQFRLLTGALQLLAAVGLLVGYAYPQVGAVAAAGLSLQMACGCIVRRRIGDDWLQCTPAALYLVLCALLALQLACA